MSIDAHISIELQDKIVPSAFVRALIDTGWGADLDGSISLLSPKTGEWERVTGQTMSYMLRWAKAHDRAVGGLGFLVVHQASGIGGEMMLVDEGRTLYWGISVNIPRIFGEAMLVDFTACLQILHPAMLAAAWDIVRVDMHVE